MRLIWLWLIQEWNSGKGGDLTVGCMEELLRVTRVLPREKAVAANKIFLTVM